MTEPEVDAVSVILHRHAIRFVVIGGQAVARKSATATHDVDVMVATADYPLTVFRLRSDKALAFDWENPQTARFRILALGGVPLDIVNAATFSGSRSAEEFFRFLSEEGSAEADGVPYATPAVVWYTRLLTKRWRAYAEKIVTNVIDGLSADHLREVEAIGRKFGTEKTLRERLVYVRDELARPDVQALVKGNK